MLLAHNCWLRQILGSCNYICRCSYVTLAIVIEPEKIQHTLTNTHTHTGEQFFEAASAGDSALWQLPPPSPLPTPADNLTNAVNPAPDTNDPDPNDPDLDTASADAVNQPTSLATDQPTDQPSNQATKQPTDQPTDADNPNDSEAVNPNDAENAGDHTKLTEPGAAAAAAAMGSPPNVVADEVAGASADEVVYTPKHPYTLTPIHPYTHAPMHPHTITRVTLGKESTSTRLHLPIPTRRTTGTQQTQSINQHP